MVFIPMISRKRISFLLSSGLFSILLAATLFPANTFANSVGHSTQAVAPNISTEDVLNDDFVRAATCTVDKHNNIILAKTSSLDSDKSNSIIKNSVSESVLLIPESKDTQEQILKTITQIKSDSSAVKAASEGGSTSAYKWDKTGTVKIYTKVFYSKIKYKKKWYANIKKVTGGYKNEGNGVGHRSDSLLIGQGGRKKSNFKYKLFTKTYKNNGKSWSKTPPSSWEPVCIDTSPHSVGCVYTVKLKRGNSKWSVTLENNAFLAGISPY